jgi:hypothetical protein
LWQYKDKSGDLHVGPYLLSKLIEWVESGFHEADMEIKQEGDTAFIKLKDVIEELEKNGKLKNGSSGSSEEEEEEQEQEQEVKVEPVVVVKPTKPTTVEPVMKVTSKQQVDKVVVNSNPLPFFSDIPLQFSSNTDPWNAPMDSSNMISASDIEKNLKLALNISQPKEDTEEEKRKKQFEEERKVHLEEHRKNMKNKTPTVVTTPTTLENKKTTPLVTESRKVQSSNNTTNTTPSVGVVGGGSTKNNNTSALQGLNLVGSGWNDSSIFSTKSLSEIQKEQKKEVKKEKKKEDEKKKAEQVASTWASNPVQVKSLSEIQKEQKKEIKKEVKKEVKKPKVVSSNNAWSTGLLSNNVVPFEEIQKKDLKEIKKEEKPKVQTFSKGAWASNTLQHTGETAVPFSKIQTEDKKKLGQKKQPNTTWNNTGTKSEKEVVPTNTDTNSFWEEEEEEEEKETSAFSSQKKEGNNNPLNAFGSLEPSQSFKDWYMKEMTKMGKKSDLTLMYYLLSLQKKQDIEDYIFEYLGENENSTKFADEFMKLKSFEVPQKEKKNKKKK